MSPHSIHLPNDKSPDSPTPLLNRQVSFNSPPSEHQQHQPTQPPEWAKRSLSISPSPPAPRLPPAPAFRLSYSPIPALRLQPIPEQVKGDIGDGGDKDSSPARSIGCSITSPSRHAHVRSYSSPDRMPHHPCSPPAAPAAPDIRGLPMIFRAMPSTLPRLITSPSPPAPTEKAQSAGPGGVSPVKRLLLRDYYPTPLSVSPESRPRWGAPPPPLHAEPEVALVPPAGLKCLQEGRYRSPPAAPLDRLQVKIEPVEVPREVARPMSTFSAAARPRLSIHPYAPPASSRDAARFYSARGRSRPNPIAQLLLGAPRPAAEFARHRSPSSAISSAVGLQRQGPRKRADDLQLAVLNEVFERTAYPNTEEREDLARRLGMTSRSVQIWFQNRRRSVKVEAQSAIQRAENDAWATQAQARGYYHQPVESRRF